MQGGFCIYIKERIYPRDPAFPNVNLVTEPLGISCATVRASSSPTVDQQWNSADFRSYWLPLTYKEFLDAGTVNFWDDTNTPLQNYRRDNRNSYRGVEYWSSSMPSAGTLLSNKYELATQSSYVGRYDYRFTFEETVSLYVFGSSTAGVPAWLNLQDT